MISNAGAAAGQEVMHTHFHVIPRFGGESPGIKSASEMVKPAEAEACLEALKKSL